MAANAALSSPRRFIANQRIPLRSAKDELFAVDSIPKCRAPVGQTEMHFPQRSQPESVRSVIGFCPRLQTTSQAVQAVQYGATRLTVIGEAPPRMRNSAPPGHKDRQKPARARKVSNKNTAKMSSAPVPQVPKKMYRNSSRPSSEGG